MKKPLLIVVSIIIGLAVISTARFGLSGEMMEEAFPAGRGVSDSVSSMPMQKTLIAPAPDYPIGIGGDNALDVMTRVNQYYGSYGVVVEDVDAYTQSIKSYISNIGGTILNSSKNKNSKYNSAYLTAKVPVARFDEATRKVTENVEEVMQESVSSSDVTGQVVNQAEELERLKISLADAEVTLANAKNDTDKRRMQIEIESLQKQIQSMEQFQENTQEQVQYATLDIQVTDSPRFFEPYSNEFDFKLELENAVESLKKLLALAGVVAIWAVVYSVVLIPAWLIIRWLKNKFAQPVKNKEV